MKLRHTVALAGLSIALSGCATVINGTSQDYTVRTDPDGAAITLNDGTTCVSPCKLNLKRRNDLRVDITKEGYKPAYVLVQSRLGGAMAGNILLGGIIGGAVDAANGSTNYLYPEPLHVRLAKLGTAEESVLLDKEGAISGTVLAHNDEVRADVAEGIGAQAAGIATTTGAADAGGAK
ncbi:PEGA domain-containing protein [Altererythrobacter sp. Root672]|uniref:PEGA domain-containing protein n=1 Tax=Altererythrobacter sp. Root672 TaxID=1736584 RepID=UPI0006FEE139|nr:PEGA domain-containing protein [Altererythrobacter sp. Root672]KRA83837.1 hypothetical protein ASD76_07425 [Altererythrobacter sp. Root672]